VEHSRDAWLATTLKDDLMAGAIMCKSVSHGIENFERKAHSVFQ
jgi:hypothetical protein